MPEAIETIRLTADVVAATADGRVLLIKRGWDPYKGHWALPGGHVDAGETSREAAARELAEETGVLVDPAALRQIGTWDEPGRDPRGRYITVAYLVLVPADTKAVAGDDATRADWWSYEDLPPLAFDHGSILDAARGSLPMETTIRLGEIAARAQAVADAEWRQRDSATARQRHRDRRRCRRPADRRPGHQQRRPPAGRRVHRPRPLGHDLAAPAIPADARRTEPPGRRPAVSAGSRATGAARPHNDAGPGTPFAKGWSRPAGYLVR